MIALLLLMVIGLGINPAAASHEAESYIVMPDGQGGIGFDDMGYVPGLRKVLVPGGLTGNLYLIDPGTSGVTMINGFSIDHGYHGGHGQSVTSADEGKGFIFIADRDTRQLHVLDPKTRTTVVSAPLTGQPDYVRFIKTTNEVWVTEPSKEQIEVFKFSPDKPRLSHEMFITVPGGPESLIEDHSRRLVYTHLWKGATVVIDAPTHALIKKWPNGCAGSRGIALDEKRGFLFAGCEEGKAVVLDLNHNGKELSSFRSGSGVDLISYDPASAHLYLPGAQSATMAILKVSPEGRLSLVKTIKTVKGGHCVASDDRGDVWVCDPYNGRLLLFKDTL
ncbi:MAG: hypothetical protein KGK03_10345 [Candidatus Omnitrophica bacterium]|nr:hypothetical protein [Candidatus Omnitrophota bacterium]